MKELIFDLQRFTATDVGTLEALTNAIKVGGDVEVKLTAPITLSETLDLSAIEYTDEDLTSLSIEVDDTNKLNGTISGAKSLTVGNKTITSTAGVDVTYTNSVVTAVSGITTSEELSKAITAAGTGALAVTLGGAVTVSDLNISRLTSLNVTGTGNLSGTLTGVKSLTTVDSKQLTSDETNGVNVTLNSEGAVSSITGLATSGKKVTYNRKDYLIDETSKLMVVDGVVYGVDDNTDVLNLAGTALFKVEGVSSLTGLTYDGTKLTVANAAIEAQSLAQNISVEKITATEVPTLELKDDYTVPTNGAWALNGTTASFNRADYYKLEGNTIVYHQQADNTEVEITFDAPVTQNQVNVITVSADKKITVAKYNGVVIPHGFEITSGSGYTIEAPTSVIGVEASTPDITTATNGTATVTGNLTEGYWLSDNKTKLNYQGEKTGVTLATITGLKTGDLNTGSLLDFNTSTATQVDLKAGALADTNVKIVNAKHPDGTAFKYTLGLVTEGAAADKVNTSKNAEATETVWTISGNTATYKDVYKAYYTTNSDKTIITYNAPSNKTIHGTINNLLINKPADADTTKEIKLVDGGSGSLNLSYTKTGETEASKVDDVIKAAGTGAVTFTVKKEAMPANGSSVTLTDRADTGSKFALDGSTTGPQVSVVAGTSPAWTYETSGSSGKATLKAQLTAGYTLTNDSTTIKTAAAVTTNTSLLVINNLNKDLDEEKWAATTDNEYYTMEGQTTALPAGKDDGGGSVGTSGDGLITIKLKKAALGTGTVSVTSPTSAFKYKLDIDDDAGQQLQAGTTTPAVADVWEFKNGVATFKQVEPEYYTLEPNGTIVYHKPVVQKTYATIKGLNSTVLAKNLVYDSTTGELSCTEKDENNQDVKTVYLKVDTSEKKIRLNKDILADNPDTSGNNIVLTQGNGSTYVLSINDGATPADATQKVQGADTTAEWWTVSDGTATLHQDIQAGYTLTNDNKTLKYTAAVNNRTLATITGLSDNVQALVEEGTAVASNASADDQKKGVKLGIAKVDAVGETPAVDAVVAHTTVNAYVNASNPSEGVATWKTGTQNITLTAAMLNKKRVSLRDNYTANGNTDNYNLVLDTNGADQPSQAYVEVTEWETGTTTAKLVNYKQGYYKEATTADGVNNLTINYTADSSKKTLLELTGLEDASSLTLTVEGDGTTADSKIKKGADDYIKLNSANGTVTVDKSGIPAATADVPAPVVTLVSRNAAYKNYTLTVYTSEDGKITYGTPAFSTASNVVTLSQTSTDGGLDLSSDGKKITRQPANTTLNLLQITGLKTTAELGNVTVTGSSKAEGSQWQDAISYSNGTVTLTRDVLGTANTIKLTSKDGGDYKLALDPISVPQLEEEGTTWQISTSGGKTQVIGKSATLEYFTLNNDGVTVTRHAETAGTQLFAITGLNAAVANANIVDKDGNTTLEYNGTEYLTFDKDAKTVTLNAAALPNDANGAEIKIVSKDGENWKFAPVTAPSYTGTGSWSVTNGVATFTMPAANVTAGYNISSDGKKLTYVTGDQVFFTISGLKTGLTDEKYREYLANAYDAGTNTVTLPKEVLGESSVSLTSKNGATYNLALDPEVMLNDVENKSGYGWYIANGANSTKNITFKSGTQAYFTPKKTTVNGAEVTTGFTYTREVMGTTLFTIYGLAETVATAQSTDKDGDARLTTSDLTEYISVDTTNNTVTLNSSILPSGNGKDGYITKINGNGYTFVNNFQAPEYNAPTWTLSGTTATMTRTASQAGYVLDNNDSPTILTYVAQKVSDDASESIAHEFLTVTGIDNTDANKDGNLDNPLTAANFDDVTNTVTLTRNQLKDAQIRLTSKNGGTYTLNLSTDDETNPVRTESTNGYSYIVTTPSTGKSQLVVKNNTLDYYERVSDDPSNANYNTFNYKAKKDGTTLFTITGLNATNVLAGTTTTTAEDGANVYTTTVHDVTTNKDVTTEYITFDKDAKTVTILNTGALPDTNANEVKITTAGYTFDQSASAFEAPVYDDTKATWSKSGTTATLNITPSSDGYELSTDCKTLTCITGDQTPMTLSGLTSTLLNDAKFADKMKDGIVVNAAEKTLTLSADVLKGTTRVTASGGYTLALDDDIRTAAGDNTKFWQVASNGSAYYKNTTQDYYEVNGKSTIIYHAPGTGSNIVAFKGLKTDGTVTTNNDGEIVDANNNLVVSIDESENIVTVNASALADSGIEITAGGSDGYKFALDTEATMSTPTYTYDPNAGTITVKATYGTGYIVSADGQTIEKIATADTEKTLATITGLKTGIEGLSVSDEVNAETASAAIAKKFTFDSVGKTLTFNDDSLFKANMSANDQIAISGDFFGYSLAVDDTNINTSNTAANKWVNNNGTLEYRSVKPAHYTVATGGKTITYTGDVNADQTIKAKITGLQSGLTWAEGTAATAFSIVDPSGNVTTEDAVSIDSDNKITLKLAALPTGTTTSEINLETTAYTLKLDTNDDEIKSTVEKSGYTWKQAVNAKSATIVADSNATYVPDATNKKITYTPAVKGGTVATITGIKDVDTAINKSLDNLGTEKFGAGNGVNVDVLAKQIYLDDAALNSSDVTVTGSGDFTLALADIQNTAASDIWTINNGTATYQNATPAYYEVSSDDANKKIKYHQLEADKTYFTISGLNSAGTINSTTVSFDGNDTVTISKDALPAPSSSVNVVIAKNTDNTDDTTTYKLSLGTMAATTFLKDEDNKDTTEVDVVGLAVEGAKTFSVSNNKVVYSASVKAGYTIDGNGAIKYVDGTQPKTYFTISGLSLPSTLPEGTASWDAYFSGKITVGDDNTITIDSTVLGTNANTKVTVSGDAYKLALADGVPTEDTVSEGYNWSKSGNNYVYKNSKPAYYTLDTTKNEISYTAPSAGTTLATVTGLNSNIDPTSNAPVVDEVSKTITLKKAHLGTSQVGFSGSSNYTFALADDVTDPSFANKWTYTSNTTSGTATLKYATDDNKYELASDAKTVKYTSASALSNNTILNITGLATGLTFDAIDGNANVVYESENKKVTLKKDALGTSNISISGSGNATLKLDDGVTNVNEATAGTSWTYSEPKVSNVDTPTFSFNRGGYYELNTTTNKAINYRAPGTAYVAISGSSDSFVSAVSDKITAYHEAVTNESSVDTAYNNLITAFTSYVTTDTTIATIQKAGENYLAATNKELTVTTNGSYSVELKSTDASSPSGATWSISSDNKLVLSSKMGAGYTLKSTKANTYTLGSTTGDAQDATAKTLATISGLNLTEAKAASNLANYLNGKIAVSGNTIQIGKDLLGTSNITITNSGDTTYKLAAGLDAEITAKTVFRSKADADEAANPAWSFSGGTATYKQTTPEYYVTNAAGTTLTYNRPVAGTTLATVRGLLNTKTEYGGEDDTAYTDTTKVGVYTIGGKDVIGAQVTRKNKAGTETVQSTTQGLELVAITSSAEAGADESEETSTTYNVKVNSAVLGTSNVTFTGSTNYKKLTLDADDAPQVAMDSYAWTGSVNGTSAVLKGNYTKGYTLNESTNTITYTAARNNVNLATITGIKINIGDDDKATIDGTAKTLAEATEAAVTAATNAGTNTNTAKTAATNEFIDAWLKAKLTGATADQIKTNDKTTAIAFTVDKDLLNSTAVTIRSGDQRKYTIALGEGAVTSATETFAWNGFNYQKFNSGFYANASDTDNTSITYTRPGPATTLATVRGLKSGVNLNNLTSDATDASGNSKFVKDSNGNITLTVNTDLLGTSKVSVATTTNLAGTFTLALASNSAINQDENLNYGATWKVNGTTATKTSGAKQAYYKLDDENNEINYTAATGVKTLATLSGLKSGAVFGTDFTETTINDVNTVTLKKAALGTSNITLSRSQDTVTYSLELDNEIPESKLLTTEAEFTAAGETFGAEYNASLLPGWITQGVNTTLKGAVSDGWKVQGMTAQHTASSTNKAIATFTFDKAGITAGDASSALSGNTITLGNLGANKRLTVRTNPDALKLKFTDFNGTAQAGTVAAVNTSVIGSASADSFEFDHETSLNNIVVSGAAGDDEIKMVDAISVASIGGGAGQDQISMAGAASNVTIYGDADNDTIKIDGVVSGNNIFYGGAGDDSIIIGSSSAKAKDTLKVYGDAGKDTIDVTAETTLITVVGGADDDNIKVTGALGAVTVSGDAGNDEINITGTAAATTVNAGIGNDIVTIGGAVSGAARIWGDAGDDKISLTGGFAGTSATLAATLNAGVGNDTVAIGAAVNYANILLEAGNDEFKVTTGGVANSTLNAGIGNDTIDITGDVTSARIWGDAGNDTIGISGYFKGTAAALSTLNAGAGNDTINITGAVDYATINVDAGDDKVTLGAVSSTSISAGAGDDFITINGGATDVRIIGDAGNDEINIKDAATNLFFSAGAGLDTLRVGGALTANTTLGASIGGDAGNDYIEITGKVTGAEGKVITINGGYDNDTIWAKGAVDYAKIMGDAGNDSIIAAGATSNATILAGAGNDTVSIGGAATNVTIFGDAGDDVINFTSGTATINGGAGNDTINITNGTNLSVLADAGNDVINFTAGSGTVYSGLGNDTVTLGDSANVTYYYEGGNDSIKGYSGDTLILKTGLSVKTASVSGGDDLILTIGSYKVTLDGAYSSGTENFSYYVGNAGGTASTVKIAGAANSSDLIYDTNGLLADNNLMTPGDISDLVSTNSVTEYHVGNYNNNIMAPDQILAEGDLISYGDDKKNK